jgi:phage replication-related protein YjqB (UPF0714/DUF867 family)
MGVHMRRADAQYACYADLAAAHVEGSDFQVRIRRSPGSRVAILAPHGGAIEAGTSEIARAVAGMEFNLYLFEGLRESGNYPALHLTSHRFDEPRCLGLLSGCDQVIAIHGCRGAAPQALLGGLDRTLTSQIGAAIAASGIEARLSGHQYPAVHPENICNRGRRGAGVQIELTTALRLRPANEAIVTAIRSVLLTL